MLQDVDARRVSALGTVPTATQRVAATTRFAATSFFGRPVRTRSRITHTGDRDNLVVAGSTSD